MKYFLGLLGLMVVSIFVMLALELAGVTHITANNPVCVEWGEHHAGRGTPCLRYEYKNGQV